MTPMLLIKGKVVSKIRRIKMPIIIMKKFFGTQTTKIKHGILAIGKSNNR